VATLISLNVGLPQDVAWNGRTVHTGIWKKPVSGPRMVRRLNVDGDGQGDLAGHGGEQRAVLVYQLESYRHWQEHFGWAEHEFGQFGENFTVDGLSDEEVCIGDRYRIGQAEFEVTQPRVTCFRVGMRLGQPELPALLVAHRRPGFYLRVITEGEVAAGASITRTRPGRHRLSVADVDALLYLPNRDMDQLRAVVDIPALSPGWQGSFHDLLAAAGTGTQAGPPPVGVEPAWSGFRPLTVGRVVAENALVTSVTLRAGKGAALPRPVPGQFVTLRLPGLGDPAPVRSYSLSGDPAADAYRISVKHEPHGLVSRQLQDVLTAGASVEVAAPRGEFVLADGANPVLLISAGIGVTPVLAMLHDLADRHSEREVWWLHTTRNAELHVFAEEARELLATLPNARAQVFYTHPDGPAPGSTAGRLTPAVLAGLGLPADADAYVCGPDAFMAEVRAALVDLGLEPNRVHSELFGAQAAINPGLVGVTRHHPHQPPGPPGPGPRVTFARSGLTAGWAAQYGSVLELAEACDVPTRWSCRTGVCHTCTTPLLAGAVSYSPAPLTEPDAGQVLLCCTLPEGDVVLDL
jgi:ferredoxin-NADP reductase/MOSC domain-containing protein YiiM/ferredoxin